MTRATSMVAHWISHQLPQIRPMNSARLGSQPLGAKSTDCSMISKVPPHAREQRLLGTTLCLILRCLNGLTTLWVKACGHRTIQLFRQGQPQPTLRRMQLKRHMLQLCKLTRLPLKPTAILSPPMQLHLVSMKLMQPCNPS